VEKEARERRAEFQSVERRLIQREELLDRKSEFLEKKDNMLVQREIESEKIRETLVQLEEEQRKTLENLAGMKIEEAREFLLRETEKEVRQELALMIKELESQAKADAEKRSKEIVSIAIQRYAADHVAETTVSVVSLPNDEMKGRIIGREGRNIRAFETLTGVDLIIDDTPEAVIISGFDAIRREVAKIALEKLIVDGRIHPARIEEMVDKAQREVEAVIREEGEQAVFEAGIHGLHLELVKVLGKLRFRTSYGQNVLKHSLEVAHLAGIMAAEIGVDVALAKRGGLLHDIGKAANHDVDGTHAQIGFELSRKYKESDDVAHIILAHHNDVEPTSIEAVLVQAADSLSAARPGARRETLEAYIKRLEKLESIADSLDGVEKAYAIQAGREIRIMVKPEIVDDIGAVKVARDVVKSIEEEMEFPGQIKVTVIRETRAIDYAK
jgi:ribonuclease Y